MIYKIIYILTFLNIVFGREINNDRDIYCLSDDPDPYLKFGSITSYDAVKDESGSSNITNYESVQIWILSRHGARHANPTVIRNMKSLIDLKEEILNNSLEKKICEKDLQALKNWRWNETVENLANDIHEQGRIELKELANRFKNRYPNLLGITYSAEDFYFRHTLRKRTEDSCKTFIDGLFGDEFYKLVKIEQPQIDDIVIHSYGTCDAWINTASRVKVNFTEKIAFLESKLFKLLKTDMSNRLGFENKLNTASILAMHENCRFDKTKYPEQISPWCFAFKKQDLLMLEYYNDLLQYYESSYGNEHSYKYGCFPLKHLRETFEKTIESGGLAKPKAVAMFTHESLFDMIFAALNFTKDDKLLVGEDYDDLLNYRKYRPSINTPLASNIAVILYKSNIEDNKYMIKILLNEKPVNLADCENGICDWETFKNRLSFTKDCSLDFCNN